MLHGVYDLLVLGCQQSILGVLGKHPQYKVSILCKEDHSHPGSEHWLGHEVNLPTIIYTFFIIAANMKALRMDCPIFNCVHKISGLVSGPFSPQKLQ